MTWTAKAWARHRRRRAVALEVEVEMFPASDDEKEAERDAEGQRAEAAGWELYESEFSKGHALYADLDDCCFSCMQVEDGWGRCQCAREREKVEGAW